ncbi:hypothetical protein GGR52DRAFT_150174 [Hypoxylon sp. FL1284]|nr:hypothetical protein GGR52DRAFT_150174 [Hypoxylon sp. FL1284]
MTWVASWQMCGRGSQTLSTMLAVLTCPKRRRRCISGLSDVTALLLSSSCLRGSMRAREACERWTVAEDPDSLARPHSIRSWLTCSQSRT